MNNENPYTSPTANVEKKDSRTPRDETRGRRAYVFQLFMIWIILPLLASYLARTFEIDSGGVSEVAKVKENEVVGSGFKLDILYVWYLQIPLFIYYTRNRVLDTGLNPWFTMLFILPVINLAMWFWPPKYK